MELSIVVPVLNEAGQLEGLLETLARQERVGFELILSDGGSRDGTVERAGELATGFPRPFRIVRGEAGRGRQQNRGAAVARGELLLFLHVDSRFADRLALRRAVDALRRERSLHAGRPVAGHFRLRFTDAADDLLAALTYWEIKARLHRFGCNHGDQGFLVSHADFARLGPFDDIPLFEDTRMAERAKTKGHLLLLPVEIQTSARRFAAEGLRQRQTLNALMLACFQVGLEAFFRQARGLYRLQNGAGRLCLSPFFAGLNRVLAEMPLGRRWQIWWRAAGFVRTQAWQLLLARRVRQGRWTPETPVAAIESALARFDRAYHLLTANPVGNFLALVLLRFWLRREHRRWKRLDRLAESA